MKAARMSFSRKIFRNHNQIRFPALPEPPKTKFQKKTTFRSRIDSTSEEFDHDDNDDERKEK